MEYRKLKDLKKLEGNPRLIKDKQFKILCDSIKDNPEYFKARPLILSNRTGKFVIIAGNQRFSAAEALGLKEVPTYLIEGITEAKEKEIIIRDNISNGEFDWDIIANQWSDLPLEAWGVGLPEDWLKGPDPEPKDAEPQIDQAEELNKKWQVALGDLWLVGSHKLLCGDSTKAEDVARLMGGEKAQLCLTSPPYGQQRDYDGDTKDKVSNWDELMQCVFRNLPMREDGQVLVNLGMIHREGEWVPYWDEWIKWMRSQGWRRFGWYVWDQGWGLPGDWGGRFAPSHEFIFHFNQSSTTPMKVVKSKLAGQTTKGKKGLRNKNGLVGGFSHAVGPEAVYTYPGVKIPDSVIRENRQCGSVNHPAPFSENFARFIISCWAGIEFDPFLGSGTTMVAAENLKRRCFGIEISPNYVAVCLERMSQAFPGIKIKKEV